MPTVTLPGGASGRAGCDSIRVLRAQLIRADSSAAITQPAATFLQVNLCMCSYTTPASTPCPPTTLIAWHLRGYKWTTSSWSCESTFACSNMQPTTEKLTNKQTNKQTSSSSARDEVEHEKAKKTVAYRQATSYYVYVCPTAWRV